MENEVNTTIAPATTNRMVFGLSELNLKRYLNDLVTKELVGKPANSSSLALLKQAVDKFLLDNRFGTFLCEACGQLHGGSLVDVQMLFGKSVQTNQNALTITVSIYYTTGDGHSVENFKTDIVF